MVSGLVKPYGELAEEGIFAVFLDPTFDQFFFGTLGVVFRENFVDLALTGKRICCVNITTDQILHDVAREFLVRLVPACQGLQDHTVAQMALNFLVESIGQHRCRSTGRVGETVAFPSGLLLVHISHSNSL